MSSGPFFGGWVGRRVDGEGASSRNWIYVITIHDHQQKRKGLIWLTKAQWYLIYLIYLYNLSLFSDMSQFFPFLISCLDRSGSWRWIGRKTISTSLLVNNRLTTINLQDPDLVDKLISELVRPVLILEIGQYVAIGVGAALVVAALFWVWFGRVGLLGLVW